MNTTKEAVSDTSLLNSGEDTEADLQDALYKQLLLQVSDTGLSWIGMPKN